MERGREVQGRGGGGGVTGEDLNVELLRLCAPPLFPPPTHRHLRIFTLCHSIECEKTIHKVSRAVNYSKSAIFLIGFGSVSIEPRAILGKIIIKKS